MTFATNDVNNGGLVLPHPFKGNSIPHQFALDDGRVVDFERLLPPEEVDQ